MRSSRQQLLAVTAREGPLYLQIYHRVRTLILTGIWPAGTQLPSSRSLARDLSVSRNTAILALEKLVADGWVVSRPGSGMYVSIEAPPARPVSDRRAGNELSSSVVPIPFQLSEAATDLFDVEQWSRIQRLVWTGAHKAALHEGAVAGWAPLRAAVSAHVNAVRGVPCSPEQVFIVPETQAALDLCVRVLSAPGDEIWIENPGYPYARAVFERYGLTQIPVPVDGDGLVVQEGIRASSEAKLAYVTPCCQFPTTALLSGERRSQLLAWAKTADSYIIEDDWDFNAAFAGAKPVEPLAASNRERVITIHSFNRILFPALRIAAVIVPEPLTERFADGLFATARFQNTANQMALARFIDEGLLSSHLRKVRLACEERRRAMIEGVRKHLWRWVHPRENPYGYHFVGWTRAGSDSDMAAAARAGGIACLGLNDFVIGPTRIAGALLLGFGSFSVDQIEAGLKELETVLSRQS